MIKDLFIDNNIAKNFVNAKDPSYLELISWIKNTDITQSYLVVSNKLLAEYNRSNTHPKQDKAMPIIIEFLNRKNKLIRIQNEQIQEFKRTYFKPKVKRKLKSNKEDRVHIPTILLSNRKFALISDSKFANDLINFSGFNVQVANKPENIDYK